MDRRVVITGLGIAAPNGVGLAEFERAVRNGVSGIRYDPELERLNFSCRISGRPQIDESIIGNYLTELELRNFNSSGILYGFIAGMDAWKDAGLESGKPDYDSGTIFGTGSLGTEKFRESIYKIDAGEARRLGSTAVQQTMSSGVSAYLAGKLGLGNQVTSNSSACCTGTESLIMAFERVRSGLADRMLAGSTGDSGPYIWGGFDAMRVLTTRHNDDPQSGSRPMSATASGFVPASGAGALVVESLESAVKRGAQIYCEILGGSVNSGGQKDPGSMVAPNPEAVVRCIRQSLERSGVKPGQVDAINGHLTATAKDALEIANWSKALGRSGTDFPLINSLKGLTGHCLAGAGSIECVASVLQIARSFVFGNSNCEDLNPEIAAIADPSAVPLKTIAMPVHYLAKASFGFGDVNACVILKKYI